MQPTRDIQPVSEFRAKSAQFIEQVRKTKQPVIITQHGRSAAVLLDIDSYESMTEELELRRAIESGQLDAEAGRLSSHEDVVKRLRAHFGF